MTKRRHSVDETVPPAATEKETLREAEKVRAKLINQVDERGNPGRAPR